MRPPRLGVRHLDPGYFAIVMATGILSEAMQPVGAVAVSSVLLVITILCYAALCATYGWRFARFRRDFLADAADPGKAFAFFTFVAGSEVLGSRLAADGRYGATVALLILAGLAWVLAALLHFPVEPAALTPAYWVFMGATAISVLAGAKLLGLPAQPLLKAVHPLVAGVSVVLWAFGTWLIPLLVGLGVWRHLMRRVRLRYEPGLWSIVFPLGMYCAASHALGVALGVPWLATVGRYGAWVALAVWVAVFGAMLAFLAQALRAVPARQGPRA
jgi:tellurite resistance protein TehA-like permease